MTLSVYVEDVDAVFDRAVKAGATVLHPVEDQFHGDRTGQFEDPFRHRWSIAPTSRMCRPTRSPSVLRLTLSKGQAAPSVARTGCRRLPCFRGLPTGVDLRR